MPGPSNASSSADCVIDVYNKIDAISLEQMNKLAHEDHTLVISCEMDLKYATFPQYIGLVLECLSLLSSLDYLIERMWADLGLVRIYTKKRGAHPDLHDPVCLRKGATIEVRKEKKRENPYLQPLLLGCL